MEPLVLPATSRHRIALTDLAIELASASTGFRRSLPADIMGALAELVRAMNCYYSNLIEGHDTNPVDIEGALKHDYSADPRKRNLQHEAEAHIAVQRWIDEDGLQERATTGEAVIEIRRRFSEQLPVELLHVEHPTTGEVLPVVARALRVRHVEVGRHVPVSPGAVPRFLERFEAAYGGLGSAETIVAAAAAHHRLLWIHPFLDGNRPVARLMSHAMLRDALDTSGVWSVARGLARNLENYKHHLAECEMGRRNDLDGRGTLSEGALASFTDFVLRTCLEQVRFMEALVQPDKLRVRIRLWAEEQTALGTLPARAAAVLDALLYRGRPPGPRSRSC